MNVFISWSGEPSRRVAEALRDWLPQVIQAVQPWMSAADVDKGARWAAQVAGQLAETKVGILCLAPDNLTAPWLLFEAGALSKTLENTHVCPYLLGVEVPAIQGPLAQFQATRANQDDTLRLVKTINGALGESALKEGQVNAAFAKWWPELEQRLTQAAAAVAQPVAPARTERSMIEEILDVVRTLARDASERDRWDRLNVALSKALGAIDTSTTTPALARLTTSPMGQAFFEVERRARLEAVAQSLLNFKPSPSTTATPEAEPLRGLLDVKPSPSTTAQPKISPAPTKPQKK